MKKRIIIIWSLIIVVSFVICTILIKNKKETNKNIDNLDERIESSISIQKIDGISEDFMLGVDVSSILSLEASGRVSKDKGLFFYL